MRIFVGTLYTIENEFEECVASIERQSYRNFQHFIFRGLRNKEAHDTLYRAFMERSEEFDLFIKVDADMVIEDGELFAKIVDKFRGNDWLRDLEIAVYDFFSAQLIWGMHTYHKAVRWEPTEEDLFVDVCPVSENERVHDDSELAPAAIHCKNPAPFQSFHYGVHRALKAIQPRRVNFAEGDSVYQWQILERTRQNFLQTADRRIGLAVLGAALAFRGGFHQFHLDCMNPYLQEIFSRYETLNTSQLKREIGVISLGSFVFLPSEMRRKVLVRVSRLSNPRKKVAYTR